MDVWAAGTPSGFDLLVNQALQSLGVGCQYFEQIGEFANVLSSH
jgi:hypothetical protein